MDDILVATFKKNAREEVRITLGEFQGHIMCSARVFFPDEGGWMRPGAKGLSLRVHHLPDLAHGLGKALQIAIEQGWLDD